MEFIWIQNVRNIDFKVISAVKNSNKFQKVRFWKEKSVEDMVTLGSTSTGHTSLNYVQMSYGWNLTGHMTKIGMETIKTHN